MNSLARMSPGSVARRSHARTGVRRISTVEDSLTIGRAEYWVGRGSGEGGKPMSSSSDALWWIKWEKGPVEERCERDF